MEKIIDSVKRAILQMQDKGTKPKKIQMSVAGFHKMFEEMDNLNDVVAIENLGHVTYFIYGLALEERNDIKSDTIFIIS